MPYSSSTIAIILPLIPWKSPPKKKPTNKSKPIKQPKIKTWETWASWEWQVLTVSYRVLPAQNLSHSYLTAPHWVLRSQHWLRVRISSVQGRRTKQEEIPHYLWYITITVVLLSTTTHRYKLLPLTAGLELDLGIDTALEIRHTPREKVIQPNEEM